MLSEHRPLLVQVSALTAIVGIGLAAALPVAPAEATTVVAVFPPWWGADAVWRAALGVGDVVEGVGASVLVLRSDAPGLASRARQQGALLVLASRTFGPCSPRPDGRPA